MKPTVQKSERRWVVYDGRAVQVWENPDVSFGATPAHLRRYFEGGSWVLLFNAITLAARANAPA
jgi:hypothetical protein